LLGGEIIDKESHQVETPKPKSERIW